MKEENLHLNVYMRNATESFQQKYTEAWSSIFDTRNVLSQWHVLAEIILLNTNTSSNHMTVQDRKMSNQKKNKPLFSIWHFYSWARGKENMTVPALGALS